MGDEYAGLEDNTGVQDLGDFDVDYSSTDDANAWYNTGNVPEGYTFDSFGNMVRSDDPAAASADPSGQAQAYLNAIQSGKNVNFGAALKSFQNILNGKGSMGGMGQIAALGGIATLLNKLGGGLGQTGQGVYRGYQGGIPNYTASRTMNPIPQTVPAPTAANPAAVAPRRPGSGGITYFTPMQYTKPAAPGGVAAPAESVAAPVEQAAGGGLMGYARGGISTLGGYSDGGRLLRGPGDGVSDSIPATIGGRQPARLADGEFVVPARIVSELGNGSTDAGAKKLYAMMDRVQNARKKTTKNVAANTKAARFLPR
jgi:hypothetical protein